MVAGRFEFFFLVTILVFYAVQADKANENVIAARVEVSVISV